jgi:Heterokaryon incompatibility protein (HET)
MRLINTATLQLEEFFSSAVPEYVILSHTWGKNEVSLQQFRNGAVNEKIKKCCAQAQRTGFRYAWVDTCCIDKTSSAELSEAINSMYRWYQNAALCYTILEDFTIDDWMKNWWDGSAQAWLDSSPRFRSCRWFTRGWTLQELVAPTVLEFYDRNWAYLGTKMSLQNVISEITEVPIEVLAGNQTPRDYNVAVRMSWASRRQTTRLEDEAYCLLGLFDVNMPMLYGEGRHAFQRLQEEILKRYEDYSIFAWNAPPGTWDYGGESSLLALSPANFDNDLYPDVKFSQLNGVHPRGFHLAHLRLPDLIPEPPSINARGISLKIPALHWPVQLRRGGRLTEVPCEMGIICCISGTARFLCILLSLSDLGTNTYSRIPLRPKDALIPHHEEEDIWFSARPISAKDLERIRYVDFNVALSNSSKRLDADKFFLDIRISENTRLLQPSRELDFEHVFRTRPGVDRVAEDVTKDFPRDLGPHGDPGPLFSRSGLMSIAYTINREPHHTAIVFGLHCGTPWCGIHRNLPQAEFLHIRAAARGHHHVDPFEIEAAGNFATEGDSFEMRFKTDICRMKLGATASNQFLVARFRREASHVLPISDGADLERNKHPLLVLEVAIDQPSLRCWSHRGVIGMRDEIGVIEHTPQWLRGSQKKSLPDIKGLHSGDCTCSRR